MVTSNNWHKLAMEPEQRLCVDMALYVRKKKAQRKKIFLDINFFVEEKEISLGKIRVGITRGRLTLQIKNGEMPLESRRLAATLPLEIEVKHTKTMHTTRSTSDKTAVRGALTTNPGENSGSLSGALKHTSGKQLSDTHSEEFVTKEVQISHGGYEQSPFWEFETRKDGSEPLKGRRSNEELGVIEINGDRFAIDAAFTTSPRSLWLSGSDGVWPKDMNASNRAVRKLVIWRWLKSPQRLNQQRIECS